MARPLLKYQTVEAKLRDLVASLPEGARLPSERELAAEFGINFLTARRGVLKLVEEGIILRKVGSGTFVGPKTPPLPASRPSRVRLGMLIPQNSDAYAHRMMQAIVQVAGEMAIEFSSAWINDYGTSALRQTEFFRTQGCQASLLPWFEPNHASEVLELARRSSLPLSHPQILFDSVDTNSSIRNIRIIVQSLCDYLRQASPDTLGFLGPDEPENTFLQQRVGAFSLYCASHDIPHLLGLVKEGPGTINQLAEKWRGHRGSLSVIAYDDDHAMRLLAAMHRIGLRAPTDFRIVGFNNVPGSRQSEPPLTTVEQDYEHIARQLLDNAITLAAGGRVNYATLSDLKLIIRDSCLGRRLVGANPDFKLPGLICRPD